MHDTHETHTAHAMQVLRGPMQYTITTASSSITSSRRRSWQKQRIAANARSANFQPLHAPSVHAGSEHVVVIYHTCIQHVSNIYQSYHTCITYMYHACISAYQGGFGHRVSRMYQCVSEARPKSVCIVCVSARICTYHVYQEWCVSGYMYHACIRVYLRVSHIVYHTHVSSVLYQVYPVCIVNLYHNSCKQQKMTDI